MRSSNYIWRLKSRFDLPIIVDINQMLIRSGKHDDEAWFESYCEMCENIAVILEMSGVPN